MSPSRPRSAPPARKAFRRSCRSSRRTVEALATRRLNSRRPASVFDSMSLRAMPPRLGAALVLCLVAGCSTPSPSVMPSPVASVAADGGIDLNLAALTDRLRAGLRQQGEFVTQLASASIESPVPSGALSMAIVAASMRTWAGTERQWLAEHPAEACYAAAQASYAAAVDAIAASAAAFADLDSASPDPSGDGGQSAVAALVGARTTIQQANSQATAAGATCSAGS